MSEEVQRRAAVRRDAAKRRERATGERADANRARGDEMLARLHQRAADRQAASAEDADELRRLDAEIEGDQLN